MRATFRALKVVLTLTVLLPLAAVAQRGISEEPGVNRRGNDYTSFRVDGLRDCKRACSRDSRCESYAYNEDNRVCYLKDRVPRGYRDSNVVSGVKGEDDDYGDGYGRGRGLTEEYGVNYEGGDYSRFRADDVRDCKSACRRDSNCRAYTFNTSSRTCYLKDRVTSPRRRSETVSGVKGDRGGSYDRDDVFDRYPRDRREGRLTEEWGTNREGGDYTRVRVDDLRECKAECWDDDRCRAYTYYSSKRECYLKDRVPGASRRSATVSGVKEY
ncbi:MAG TPA: PAN/Apple domain-containing protein [Thermoanaerobaculia bacterium]|nr:PAN/Apple domain-containing protein [Thermoanaerobaculia bacterium]